MSEQNEREAFELWLESNYLFDKSNFIPDEHERKKVQESGITWKAWQHQQQRINELEAIIADRTKDIIKTNEMVKSLRDCQ